MATSTVASTEATATTTTAIAAVGDVMAKVIADGVIGTAIDTVVRGDCTGAAVTSPATPAAATFAAAGAGATGAGAAAASFPVLLLHAQCFHGSVKIVDSTAAAVAVADVAE